MSRLIMYGVGAVRRMDYATLTDELVLFKRVKKKYQCAIYKTAQLIEYFEIQGKSQLVEPQRRKVIAYALDLKDLDAYLLILNYRLDELAHQVSNEDLLDLI